MHQSKCSLLILLEIPQQRESNVTVGVSEGIDTLALFCFVILYRFSKGTFTFHFQFFTCKHSGSYCTISSAVKLVVFTGTVQIRYLETFLIKCAKKIITIYRPAFSIERYHNILNLNPCFFAITQIYDTETKSSLVFSPKLHNMHVWNRFRSYLCYVSWAQGK